MPDRAHGEPTRPWTGYSHEESVPRIRNRSAREPRERSFSKLGRHCNCRYLWSPQRFTLPITKGRGSLEPKKEHPRESELNCVQIGRGSCDVIQNRLEILSNAPFNFSGSTDRTRHSKKTRPCIFAGRLFLDKSLRYKYPRRGSRRSSTASPFSRNLDFATRREKVLDIQISKPQSIRVKSQRGKRETPSTIRSKKPQSFSFETRRGNLSC